MNYQIKNCHIVLENMLTGLQMSGELDFGNPDLANLRIGIRNDLPILQSILSKAMDTVTLGEIESIKQKWLPGSASERSKITYTAEEKDWIADHPQISVGGEMDWGPFDFVDDSGEYAGLANDYLKIIGSELGIEVKVITGPSWSELVEMIRRREIDVLPAIYYSKEREAYLHYTEPYEQVAEFIFTKSSAFIAVALTPELATRILDLA